jgi:hypothetical protein
MMTEVVNKLEALLTDDARVVNYVRNMFIVQAIGLYQVKPARTNLVFLENFEKTNAAIFFHS